MRRIACLQGMELTEAFTARRSFLYVWKYTYDWTVTIPVCDRNKNVPVSLKVTSYKLRPEPYLQDYHRERGGQCNVSFARRARHHRVGRTLSMPQRHSQHRLSSGI